MTEIPHPKGFARVPINHELGYRPLGTVLRKSFGERVYKVSLDGGYTCPNRDGTLAEGGCVYCGEGSRGMIARAGALRRQFDAAVDTRAERRFFAYFQAYSGTYAPLDVLRRHWRQALSFPRVCGLAVSTRPDCLPTEVVEELSAISREVPLWVEVGLESGRDATLQKIGRAHTVAQFESGVKRLADAGIAVVAHLIFGLPQEPWEASLEAVDLLRALPIWGVKLHPFHIVDGAPIARAWRAGHVQLMERNTYIQLAAQAIHRFDPRWVVHRISAAAPPERHLAPEWGRDGQSVRNDIHAVLRQNGWIQGGALPKAA